MINQLDALAEVEQILSDHWTYSVLPTERRAIRAAQRLEARYTPPEAQPDEVTWQDLLLPLLAAVLLVLIGAR